MNCFEDVISTLEGDEVSCGLLSWWIVLRMYLVLWKEMKCVVDCFEDVISTLEGDEVSCELLSWWIVLRM